MTERLRDLYDLPAPEEQGLPTFEQLKFGIPKYGAGRDHDQSEEEKRGQSSKFFRRGKAGGWKQDMPEALHDLFWSYHGDAMRKYGYTLDGSIEPPDIDFDSKLANKLGAVPIATAPRKHRVLIESDKIASADNDGVKRYQVELLRSLMPVVENPASAWEIDLYLQQQIVPLRDAGDLLAESFKKQDIAPSTGSGSSLSSMAFKLEGVMISLIPKRLIAFLSRHNITVFHATYDAARKVLVSLLLGGRQSGHFSNDSLTTVDSAGLAKHFDKYDLIHLPLKQNYKAFSRCENRFLVTLHDLTHVFFPDYHSSINIQNASGGMQFLQEKDADVIAISQSTGTDAIRSFDVPESKVHVIYEAADRKRFNTRFNQDDCRAVRLKYNLDFNDPYVICLSTLEPRKNLENTLQAFTQLKRERPEAPLKLVIAGKKGWQTENLFVSAQGHKDDIFFTGFVDDQDLPYLYSGALAMSYVSFYEGFGLPPLEAMCCGTPIVYGNNSSLLEVVGPGGLAADPSDIGDIKDQYMKLLEDETLRESLGRAALRQSLQFSWRTTAMQTLAVYRKLIEGEPSRGRLAHPEAGVRQQATEQMAATLTAGNVCQ
jgi:glycosyltransferase involved in cell wall biosynthesis